MEGGNFDTIQSWSEHMKKSGVMTPPPSPPQPDVEEEDDEDVGSRPPSSGLSSIGDGEMPDFGGGATADEGGTGGGRGRGGGAVGPSKDDSQGGAGSAMEVDTT